MCNEKRFYKDIQCTNQQEEDSFIGICRMLTLQPQSAFWPAGGVELTIGTLLGEVCLNTWKVETEKFFPLLGRGLGEGLVTAISVIARNDDCFYAVLDTASHKLADNTFSPHVYNDHKNFTLSTFN